MVHDLATRAVIVDAGCIAADGPAGEILAGQKLLRAHSLDPMSASLGTGG